MVSAPSPPDDRFSDKPTPENDPWDDREKDHGELRYDNTDDIERRIRRKNATWADRQFNNTDWTLLLVSALFCNVFFLLPLVLETIGLLTCQDPDARQRAKIVTTISAVVTVIVPLLVCVAPVVPWVIYGLSKR